MRGFFYHLVKKSELYFVVRSSERKFSVPENYTFMFALLRTQNQKHTATVTRLKASNTAKAGQILPNVEYVKPKILGVMNAPYAATAATKPVIKEESNGLPNT